MRQTALRKTSKKTAARNKVWHGIVVDRAGYLRGKYGFMIDWLGICMEQTTEEEELPIDFDYTDEDWWKALGKPNQRKFAKRVVAPIIKAVSEELLKKKHGDAYGM